MAEETAARRDDWRSHSGGRPGSTVLIVADSRFDHWSFSDAIVALGRPSITVRGPADAVAALHAHPRAIGAVLGPVRDPRHETLEFFANLRDAFPRVRRIAFARDPLEYAEARGAGLLDGLVTVPTPLYWLGVALGPVPRRPLRRSRGAALAEWTG